MLNAWAFRKNCKSSLTKKSGGNAVFLAGLIVSCIGETALFGHAVQMPQLYYEGVLGAGLDFILAVLFLSVGNIILLLGNFMEKTNRYFCKSIAS